ncbi:hypothetical protein IW140_001471 [Coemansia sp. RSA 1813]|nr:hypothetical protein EV178_003290 [Coemansia sp. RSA 1646]KAJ1771543.1 hypothetical protein LPJ74_002231 [Coemansia sp. RSA 1843]KAJ2089597.1 hypothetical protein IW138_003339 [Coemansia sp. RSA 986]KAJ2214700.1 hypothetical protein EV179_002805 [Coemansia sp. RSA 487]KAJ2571553.1 hypothetical protein IW140_001471 [Coemansia sp. RSA 1813]
MPRTAASRLSSRPTAGTTAGDLSSCGSGLVDGLPNSLTSGGLSLGHSDVITRKRSLDNMENIPPYFGLDSPSQLSLSASDSKPAMSLLDMTAQQLSQSQRKHRRTAITASSPGGHQRISSNPRHIARLSDASSFLHSLPLPHSGTNENKTTTTSKPAESTAPQSSQSAQKPRLHIPLQPIAPKIVSGNANVLRRATFGSSSGTSSTRLRRLPKRNLKPLDFSGLHPSRMTSAHSAELGSSPSVTADGVTASAKSGTCTSGASSALPASGAPDILSLPVSPTSPSPGSGAPIALIVGASTPASTADTCASANPKDAIAHAQPTPPSTVSRSQPAFSGLLASAYQRASAKRSSRRALVFESCAPASDEALLESDPILGPRCPVIGDPRGIFDLQSNGIDVLRREQAERTESRFSEMTRAVRQAQAAFEAAVSEQTTKGRPASKKVGRPSTPAASGTASKRPISQCKYCGKQYKYHSKLASHEQHCSSRLEALLYSADDSEQHIIHCVCGPRHDYPVGERDDLPMIQCDNCFLWLHIECVGVDQNDLPNEYFCVRCSESADDKQPKGYALKGHSTPKRRVGLGSNGAASMMSPESHRLATLLECVPDHDGSETEEEPMNLKVKGRSRRGRPSRKNKAVGSANNADDFGSEDTMSISDVAEVTRFHRQGSAQGRSKSPIAQRMAQSEADAPAQLSPPRRRHVRASGNDNQQTVHTDALSSDFLGMPLPESIFSEKPRFDSGNNNDSMAPGSVSIAPGICSQQPSMEDLTRLFTGSQPQWSLAQINSMLNCSSANGMSRQGSMASAGSSFSLDIALADLGLGLGNIATSAGVGGVATAALANARIQANGGSNSMPHAFVDANTPLSELVDLPVDNEFSALLESFASANPGTDADPYSSLGVDSGLGGILSDDILLDVSTSMPLGTSISAPLANNGRSLAGRIAGSNVEIEHGSSSTITLMHDESGLESQGNNVHLPAGGMSGVSNLPPPARPPPGMPGVARNRSTGAKENRVSQLAADGSAQMQMQRQASSSNVLGSSAGFCLASNPPSTSGLSEADVSQLLSGTGAGHFMDWPCAGSDVLDQELEGLINFDG